MRNERFYTEHWSVATFLPGFIARHFQMILRSSIFNTFSFSSVTALSLADLNIDSDASWMCCTILSYADFANLWDSIMRPQNTLMPSRAIPRSLITNTIRLLVLWPVFTNGPELISLLPHTHDTTILKPNPRWLLSSNLMLRLHVLQINISASAKKTVTNSVIL